MLIVRGKGDKQRSLSSWRAWIEMAMSQRAWITPSSLSSWRAWIEIKPESHTKGASESLSSWRAWIEISSSGYLNLASMVALLMESVD